MTRRGVPTTDGKPQWRESTVLYILTNEKYIGNSLCQKKFSAGFPFRKQLNHGEKDQYYIEQTHPAIIKEETFEKAKMLLEQRGKRETAPHRNYPLTKKILCGHCGSVFSRRVAKSGQVCWVCRKHNKNAAARSVGPMPEENFYSAFVGMYRRLRANMETVLKPSIIQLETLNDLLQRKNPEILAVNRAIAEVNEQAYHLNQLQASGLLDADICTGKLAQIADTLLRLRRERRQVLQNDDIVDTAAVLRETMKKLADGPERLEAFDEALFAGLVDTVVVESESRLRFLLYGGYELAERMKGAE